jgi:hypothetical protein
MIEDKPPSPKLSFLQRILSLKTENTQMFAIFHKTFSFNKVKTALFICLPKSSLKTDSQSFQTGHHT